MDMKPLPPNHCLRPLSPDDNQRLVDFFQSHSQETVYWRYGYPLGEMTLQHATELVSVDQVKNVALGIFERQGDRESLHAVGRYYTERDNLTAELGIVVRETKRRLGFATTLLTALARTARERGLHTIRAYVLHDNYPMRDLASRYAERFCYAPGTGGVNYYMTVDKILGVKAPTNQPARSSSAPMLRTG